MNITYKLYRVGSDEHKYFLFEYDDYTVAEDAFRLHKQNGLAKQKIILERHVNKYEVILSYEFTHRVANGEPV